MSKIGFPKKVLGKTKICDFRFFKKKRAKTINSQKDLKDFEKTLYIFFI